MKREKDENNLKKNKEIAKEIIPVFEKLPPEKKERVLGYALGLADSRETVGLGKE